MTPILTPAAAAEALAVTERTPQDEAVITEFFRLLIGMEKRYEAEGKLKPLPTKRKGPQKAA